MGAMQNADEPLAMRQQLARHSLEGLSIADALGQTFFHREAEAAIAARRLPVAPWLWTDDTHMAMSVVEVLGQHGCIDRDALASAFARRHTEDPMRGYGAGARRILQAIAAGTPWQQAAGSAFDGCGSMGNGAAMRAAPIGAFFADDLARVAAEARASAAPTHAHAEGQAGAIAVAIAAALATRRSAGERLRDGTELLRQTAEHTPAGAVRDGILKALELGLDGTIAAAAAVLGNGAEVLAPDTVPFALWCAARHLDDYEAAIWSTVAGLGDRDTTCAIVGSIVVMRAGPTSIPASWRAAREPLGNGFDPAG